jgi:acyl-CoA thioesterase
MRMNAMVKPEIAAHIQQDAFTNFLGATVETIDTGYCRVSLVVTESMLNFHGITHGGIVFGLGDIAFAAASNSHGQKAVALNVSTTFLRATKAGDHLVAEAKEVSMGGATALYEIVVTEKQTSAFVAKSQALVYRKREALVV